MNTEYNSEFEESYDDMDAELDRQEVTERCIKSLNNLALSIMSRDQLKDIGSLLGHYKSPGFLGTYIDVYERAVVGKGEMQGDKKPQEFSFGYVLLERAVVEKRTLYLIRKDDKICRVRHLKSAEKVAYLINEQKAKLENGGSNEKEE